MRTARFTSLSDVSDPPSSGRLSEEPDTGAAESPVSRHLPRLLRTPHIARSPAPTTPRAEQPPRTRQQIVNGLDRREVILGIILTSLGVFIALVGYHFYSVSKTATIHANASAFLVSALVGSLLVGLGTAVRRRALLGFACFLTGLALLNYKFVPGAFVYLGVGGWLIMRVSQKQRLDRATRPARSRTTERASAKGAGPAGPPRASKRYTPPKHSTTGRRN